MYTFIAFALVAAGIALAGWGVSRGRWKAAAPGIALVVATPLFFWLMGFWGELLWFENLGYGDRYLIAIAAKIAATASGAALGAVVLWGLTWQAARNNRILKLGMLTAGVVLGAVWGSANWETALQFIYQPETSTTDPILHHTTGFYLFSLPFYNALQGFMLLLAIVGTGGVLSTCFRFNAQKERIEPRHADTPQGRWSWLNFNAAVLFVVLSAGLWLSRYELMYSESGIVTGPGWVDARVRLPTLTGMAVVLLILAVGVLLPPLQRGAKAIVHKLIPAYAPTMSELGLPSGRYGRVPGIAAGGRHAPGSTQLCGNLRRRPDRPVR